MIHQNNIEKNILLKKINRLKELGYNFDSMGSPPPCRESISCIDGFVNKLDDCLYDLILTHSISPTETGTILYKFSTENRKFELEFGKNRIYWLIMDSDNNEISEIDKIRTYSERKDIPNGILKEFK